MTNSSPLTVSTNKYNFSFLFFNHTQITSTFHAIPCISFQTKHLRFIKEDGNRFVVSSSFCFGKQRKQNADLLTFKPIRIPSEPIKWSVLNNLLISGIIQTICKKTFPLFSIYSLLKDNVVQSRVIKHQQYLNILFNVQQRRRKLTSFSDIISSLISVCVQVQTTGVIASRPLNQVPMIPYQRPLPTAKISQKVYFPSTRRNQVNPSPEKEAVEGFTEEKELAKALALLALPNR